MTIYKWISEKTGSPLLSPRFKPRERSAIIIVTLLVLILATVPPKTLKPQRYERLPEKWAGIWIKSQSEKGMTLFTTVPRVAFYADGNYEYIDLRKSTVKEVKTSILEKKALYLVMCEKDVIDYPEEVKLIQEYLVEANRLEQEGTERMIIYKIIH